MKKKMITLRIEEELKAFLQEYAQKDRRKLSNFLLHTATTYIRQEWGVNWEDVRLSYIKKGTKGSGGDND